MRQLIYENCWYYHPPGPIFGALVWVSILQYNTILQDLDGVLALATRMAFSLEQFTFTEASLASAGLMAARQHIFRSLTSYMLRRHRAQLVESDLSRTPHPRYVTPFESGWACFQHRVWGKASPNTTTTLMTDQR